MQLECWKCGATGGVYIDRTDFAELVCQTCGWRRFLNTEVMEKLRRFSNLYPPEPPPDASIQSKL